MIEVLIANSIAKDAGLHGSTIAPKKSPKMKALRRGFLVTGALTLGKSFPKSKLNIKKILMMVKIPNAIGEIIPITFVKDFCKKKVKIKPNKNIEVKTPKLTTIPNPIIVFFSTFLSNLLAK